MSRFATNDESRNADSVAALALVRALTDVLLDTGRLSLEEVALIQRTAIEDLDLEQPAGAEVAKQLILEAFP
jgi:hypothetical protein